jgi:hypothetical protein
MPWMRAASAGANVSGVRRGYTSADAIAESLEQGLDLPNVGIVVERRCRATLPSWTIRVECH